jgi:hypothetical protein
MGYKILLLVGCVLVGVLLVGCGEEPDYALIADQLEEQLERVLDGKNDNYDHIEIEECPLAALIRNHIAALSLKTTLLWALDIEELEFSLADKLKGKSESDKYWIMASYMNDAPYGEWILRSVGWIYYDLEKLRDQAKE